MKVLTLSAEELSEQTHALSAQVRSHGFVPELVVGIRTGGEHVARMAMPAFPEARLAIVKRQRSSTKLKRRFEVGNLLGHLPQWITNPMRIAEHRVREKKFYRQNSSKPYEPQFIEKLEEFGSPLGAGGYAERRILVIDDAIDSGKTMIDVVNHLSGLFPGAEIRTLAVAVTMRRPLIEPDYVLTGPGTLVRFFWSEDYHARG